MGRKKRGLPPFWGFVLPVVIFFCLPLTRVGENASFAWYDYLVTAHGRGEVPANIVVVAIDEPSFQEIGQPWPWSRRLHAELVQQLAKAGAVVVAFDVLFVESSRDPEEDTVFAAAIRRAGNVILGATTSQIWRQETVLSMVVEPLPILARAAQEVATVYYVPDSDGIARRAMASVAGQNSLAEAAVRQALGALKTPPPVTRSPSFSDEPFLINYAGPPGTIPTVSYYEALVPERYLPGDFFKDKIVLVGFAVDAAVAVQGAVDAFPTPFFKWSRRMMHGVEIHANTVATIWAGRPLVSYAPLWLAALFASLSLSPWFAREKPLLLFSATSGLLLTLTGVSVLFFRWQLLHIDVVPALAATVGSSLWWGVTGFIATVREKLEMRRAFDRYVPPEVVGEIIRNPAMLALGGQRKELSVLFSDIRGFTSISEKITPEQLVALLNSYLDRMTNVVFANHGTLDKYIGDAVMAIFGAPLPRNDHAVWACRAALAMLQRLEEVVPEWHAAGLDRPRIGIGVNSGEMIVGNIGSEQRLDYTVIGDAVNLASRLEGLNKTYGTAVIISEETRRAVGQQFLCRELDFVRVKGKERPVRIYELLAEAGGDGGDGPRLQIFAQGLEAYRNRLWDQAALVFRRVLADYPADGPARLFLQRCAWMKEQPPGEEWDGVWVMLNK